MYHKIIIIYFLFKYENFKEVNELLFNVVRYAQDFGRQYGTSSQTSTDVSLLGSGGAWLIVGERSVLTR